MTYSEFTEKFHITLSEEQNQAVQASRGPVLLLAVPGSGKTTVLVARLGYLIYGLGLDPAQILTVTYTVAAARDMEERFFRVFGGQPLRTVPFSTIHSFCAGVIRRYERLRHTRAFDLISREMEQSRILRELIRQQTGEYPGDALIREAGTRITFCKNKMLAREEIEKITMEKVNFPQLFFAYESWKRERRRMDFDDQLEFARRILLKNPDILAYYRHQYRYIQVDEAQDTSRLQHVILRMLLGPERNLFLVGDEDQSIYGFRAAYPQALLDFPREFPEAKVLYMQKNYRSLPEIVTRADRFIGQNQDRYAKHMQAVRPAVPGRICVQQLKFADSSRQYDWILTQARSPQEQTAVLYRNHDSALPLIDRLEQAGLPYRLREGNGLFFSHFAVQDILDILRFARRPENPALFRRIYYKMGCPIRREELSQALAAASGGNLLQAVENLPTTEAWKKEKLKELRGRLGRLRELPSPRALTVILQELSYQEYFYRRSEEDGKLRILRALADQNREQDAFLRRLEQLKDLVKNGAQDSRFILSTMHASKGLEFDRVILLDVRDGILPAMEEPAFGGQLTSEERALLEEERRLFYVAVTRARNRLEILSCRREFGANVRDSSFIRRFFQEEKAVKAGRKKLPPPGRDKRLGTFRDYQPGDGVWHVRFGEGSVVSRDGEQVTVAFAEKGGTRSFSLPVCLESCLLYLLG